MQTIQVLSALFKALKIHFSKVKGKLYHSITCLLNALKSVVLLLFYPHNVQRDKAISRYCFAFSVASVNFSLSYTKRFSRLLF